MDTALVLRMKSDRGEKISDEEIDSLLEQSKLVRKLTSDCEENPFFYLFRLLCLSEIPYIERLSYTQELLAYISANLSLPEGFSYTGDVNYIVPCYNSLLLEAYSRLGKASSEESQNALSWIKKYQVFERNQATAWSCDRICKHGGCMRAVPCYIGIGKTVRALITYAEYTAHTDREVESLIKAGTEYMLRHHMYQRLSNGAPVSAHITDIMFPQAYMLSATDLVYIAGKTNSWKDTRTQALRALLDSRTCNKKPCETGSWRVDYIYGHKGYKAFDGKRKPSEWVDYLFHQSFAADL